MPREKSPWNVQFELRRTGLQSHSSMHAFMTCHWQGVLRLDVGEPGQAAVAVLVFDAAGVCMLDGLVRAAAAVAV